MTQTRKEALIDLLAKVEAGSIEPEVCEIRKYAQWCQFGPNDTKHAECAYNGSLDAAKALRMAVSKRPLPEKIFSDARKELIELIREMIEDEQA